MAVRKVIERKHAAAMELNETGLETLGAPRYSRSASTASTWPFEVVHMAVRRLLAVRLRHRFRLSRLVGQSMARAAVQPTSPVTLFDGVHEAIE